MDRTRLLIIGGPTASGKTAVAVELATRFDAEVISADSMQVYRLMDIGTGKPTLDERKGVAHHLIDVVYPDEEYTAARFRDDAAARIAEIASRGRRVIVAGGTGLYIRALTRGLFSGPEADWGRRRELIELASDKGREHLHEMLRKADPESAALIHPNNINRVVRAIEVSELAGRPMSALQKEHAFGEAPYECLSLALDPGRDALYKAIDSRVDGMMAAGLLEETRALLDKGYASDLKPMCGLGYKEMCAHIGGEYPLDEAVRLTKLNTRRYAKRQLTWFRKDTETKWFRPEDMEGITQAAAAFLC